MAQVDVENFGREINMAQAEVGYDDIGSQEQVFRLTSPELSPGGRIPRKYTADGQGSSLKLSICGV